MLSVNSPFGFRPVSRVGGAPWSTTAYGKPSSDANAIFMFDMVQKKTYTAGNGLIALPESPQGYYLPTLQTGYQGTPGTGPWLGVSLNYGAASTGTEHMVVDETDVIFLGQSDGSNNALFTTQSQFTTSPGAGKNANINIATAGSATTKQSQMSVAASTIATTSTLDLRILKVATISPNLEGYQYPILEVTILNHFFAPKSAGV